MYFTNQNLQSIAFNKKDVGLLDHLGYFCGRRLTQGTLYTINESIVQSTLEK